MRMVMNVLRLYACSCVALPVLCAYVYRRTDGYEPERIAIRMQILRGGMVLPACGGLKWGYGITSVSFQD